MNKAKRLCLACALCMMLTACTSDVQIGSDNQAGATLAPAQNPYAAPVGDTQQDNAQTVLLFLPNRDGTRFIAVPERVPLPSSRHPADAVARRLLAHGGTDDASPLSQSVELSLSQEVETTDEVATVSLSASALSLGEQELFTVCQALCNTLTQWGDIKHVNVLIAGVQPGLDTAALTPPGCFSRNVTDDIAAQYERTLAQKNSAGDETRSFSAAAALYCPAPQGKGVLASARTLVFTGRDQGRMALVLLKALVSGASSGAFPCVMPDLSSLLTADPYAQALSGGGRKLVLNFDASLNQALADAGLTRSVTLASLTLTMTTFLPGVTAVEMHIGDETVTTMVPAGIYEGAGKAVTFTGGLMKRSDFTAFLLGTCTLCLQNSDGALRTVRRPVPYYLARSPGYLLAQLTAGPQAFDSVGDTHPALPEGLTEADILGVSLQKDAVLVNLSPRAGEALAALAPDKQRVAVYAVVNTLTLLPGVRRVRLYVQGEQPEALLTGVYLPGEFITNPGMTSQQ